MTVDSRIAFPHGTVKLSNACSILLSIAVVLSLTSSTVGATDIVDDFSDANFKGRQAERGDWKFVGNTASVVSDPTLYKKYKNHGPILKWPVDCTSGEVEFEMKASECQRVVFTLNGDGHVFRISLIDPARALTPYQAKANSRILAWATKSSKENKGDSLKPKGLPSLADIDGEWTKVKLTVNGDLADIQIGDFKAQLKHAALLRDKNIITLSFASGSFAVRDFHFQSKPSDASSKTDGDPQRPNILIIFSDDQGYADLACYGNEKNRTPRLDQLASEGTRFTSFYSQTVCGPSRSALLTGRYPMRSKGWGMPATETTFAELMQKSGYQTACIGKWDVSNRKPIVPRMPLAQGFDYYFGPLGANDGGGVKFHENNEPAGTSRDMGELTTMYTEKAITYLTDKRDPEKPFVLYVAHTMMHTVIDASDRFRGKSAGGLYGDVVEEFDFETGRLLDTLDELGLSDDTLVIYTSDNGPWNQDKYTKKKKGHPEGSIFWGESGPLRNGKGSCYEGGYRLPCIVRWPGKVPAGRVSDAVFATVDFLPTFAALAGFEVPGDRTIDGIDQTGLLLAERETGREHFYFHDAGVRKGKWKFLKSDAHFYNYAIEDDREKVDELYDLEADLGEQVNLAEKYPETVAELRSLMLSIEGNDKPTGPDSIR